MNMNSPASDVLTTHPARFGSARRNAEKNPAIMKLIWDSYKGETLDSRLKVKTEDFFMKDIALLLQETTQKTIRAEILQRMPEGYDQGATIRIDESSDRRGAVIPVIVKAKVDEGNFYYKVNFTCIPHSLMESTRARIVQLSETAAEARASETIKELDMTTAAAHAQGQETAGAEVKRALHELGEREREVKDGKQRLLDMEIDKLRAIEDVLQVFKAAHERQQEHILVFAGMNGLKVDLNRKPSSEVSGEPSTPSEPSSEPTAQTSSDAGSAAAPVAQAA